MQAPLGYQEGFMSTKEIVLPTLTGDLLLVRLAREIAMDQHELGRILERAGVSPSEFENISRMPRFQVLLQQSIINWEAAENTTERVKLKSAAMIEEWLPEAFTQMHNLEAPLMQRTDLAKLISRLGGMDKGPMGIDGSGERFSVTINLGADKNLAFSKEQLLPKVIENE